MVQEDEELVNAPKQDGENFLKQRVSLGRNTLEPFQRRNLFRIHCKSRGKICNVNLDGGSIVKLVDEEMV